MTAKPKTPTFSAQELAEVESPELTDEGLASLRPASEALSPSLYAALTGRKPGQRGPQKAPTKEMITLRVDRDVVAAYRAGGPGWQRRMNDALRAAATPKGR
jgi:uncharacterized protein (DUF4415 family)